MSVDSYGDLSQFSMLDLFRMEAEGQARTLTDGLLSMERGGAAAGAVDELMRAAHSIKGAAAIVNLDVAVQVAHVMEDAFVAAQNGLLEMTPARIDVLLSGVDLIVQLAALTEDSAQAWIAQNTAVISSTIAAIAGIAHVQPAAPAVAAPAASPAPPPPADSAPLTQPQPRASQSYDKLLALAGESRINAHQMRPLIESVQRHKRNQSSVLQAIEQLHDAIMRSGDAALVERSAQLIHKAAPLKQFAIGHMADIENYERRVLGVSAALVDEVLALRMRPFGDGVHAFPRMVRDLARSLGKEAQLVIDGEDTLVDRDILAKIESPLNHLLRNAVDHGMEMPDQRVGAGKPAAGSIRLEARHRAGMLNIEISDDGRGVDLERIRANVVARGMSSDAMAAAMSPAELLEFLFLPAFSLKETTSEISGRGVGLDVVQQVIREQNGSVRIESQPGLGFRTSITLPLTQSIVRALVFDIQGEAYAIPIVKVERVLKIAQSAISTLENKQFVDSGGEHLGLVPAAQVLALGQFEPSGDELSVLVIGSGQRRYALVVDAIRGEHSLAVQALDPIFGKMRDISAAALLDDGAPVLILDVADLLLSIDKLLHEGGLHKLSGAGGAERRRSRRVLVVDDSLTVREMERKLLLGRGYQVDVAIDGMDGWNAVRSGDYDLVITDVDMPRLDGIELVALIRKDLDLHKLPVMIVSYKDRPEDRARGMAAGADYYLTKGSFHDETLLDAVFDLIGDPGL
ncbi:hybrid sensor histidine kinase/response regulator [Massilia soli]|uniref:histidine kinase n=1 Tax=Massilia soli TaxID=2792854 RepID=A0ABS7SLU4_9BURK|nr:hybrid sensor histidine kinase/response regulator [Massilia soli]MBZ2206914.1 hybrid sensor histidine kinase/response regulator [Massilia soli]